jgi:hypothetical protein
MREELTLKIKRRLKLLEQYKDIDEAINHVCISIKEIHDLSLEEEKKDVIFKKKIVPLKYRHDCEILIYISNVCNIKTWCLLDLTMLICGDEELVKCVYLLYSFLLQANKFFAKGNLKKDMDEYIDKNFKVCEVGHVMKLINDFRYKGQMEKYVVDSAINFYNPIREKTNVWFSHISDEAKELRKIRDDQYSVWVKIAFSGIDHKDRMFYQDGFDFKYIIPSKERKSERQQIKKIM